MSIKVLYLPQNKFLATPLSTVDCVTLTIRRLVHGNEGKDEVRSGRRNLVPELVSEEERYNRLHHDAECIRRQQRCTEYRAVSLSDQLHYYNE